MKVIEVELKNRTKIKDNIYIPAILYGKNLKENYACMVNKKEFVHLVKTSSRNAIFNCKLEDGRVFPSLIKEIQKDVMNLEPIHIDFFAINLEEKIHMSVPISSVGESLGAKKGGILEQATFRLDLKGQPVKIPDRLNINISNLDIGDSIHAGEIELPEGVELATAADTSIFSVVPPTIEEEVQPTVATTPTTPTEEAASPPPSKT